MIVFHVMKSSYPNVFLTLSLTEEVASIFSDEKVSVHRRLFRSTFLFSCPNVEGSSLSHAPQHAISSGRAFAGTRDGCEVIILSPIQQEW